MKKIADKKYNRSCGAVTIGFRDSKNLDIMVTIVVTDRNLKPCEREFEGGEGEGWCWWCWCESVVKEKREREREVMAMSKTAKTVLFVCAGTAPTITCNVGFAYGDQEFIPWKYYKKF